VIGVDASGAALVAAVGLLGAALLTLGHRLGVVGEQRARLARRVAEAEAALAGQETSAAERRLGELAEVQATVRTMLDRAEAARHRYEEKAA
jgi:hypothetical protein